MTVKWEACLERLKALVVRQLDTNTPSGQKLKSSDGIGIGFVDGDLQMVWRASDD